MSEFIEYRVRPITRYVVTRYHREDDGDRQGGGSSTHGEFTNHETAYAVGYALARAEHGRLGYPLEDMRIIYPEPSDSDPAASQAIKL